MTNPIQPSKLDAARELHAAGHSQTYVVQKVGIAPETMRRHGIVWTANRHDDSVKEQVRALYVDKGMSAGEVGIVMDMTRNQVVGLVARMGLKRTESLHRANSVLKRHKSDAPKVNPVKPPKKPKPVVVVIEAARVEPRPFIDRGTGCPWIVSGDDAPVPMACCGVVVRGSYCGPHAARAYEVPKTPGKDLARFLRRYL